PDRITIFRNPTLAICESEDEVVEEVNITVVHEIAHHFGIDDDRLHELGYDGQQHVHRTDPGTVLVALHRERGERGQGTAEAGAEQGRRRTAEAEPAE